MNDRIEEARPYLRLVSHLISSHSIPTDPGLSSQSNSRPINACTRVNLRARKNEAQNTHMTMSEFDNNHAQTLNKNIYFYVVLCG